MSELNQTYPEHPGFQGRNEISEQNSREAADQIAPIAHTQRAKILSELLNAFPESRSSEQLAQSTGYVVYSVRSRISGLVEEGKVEATNETAKNDAGRSVTLWRAVP